MWPKLGGGLKGDRCYFRARRQLSTGGIDGTNHLSATAQVMKTILTSKVV